MISRLFTIYVPTDIPVPYHSVNYKTLNFNSYNLISDNLKRKAFKNYKQFILS